MIAIEIIATIISLFAFFFGAFKLWKKGKPLYFQIIICAVGCYALYQLSTLVLSYCNIETIDFNICFFGLFGCGLFLFSANNGAMEKVIDQPKTRFIIISALFGLLYLALSIIIGVYYFGIANVVFYIFVVIQIPPSFVVYFNVKHLFSPNDDLGLKKGLKLTDICSIIFCALTIVNIALWVNVNIFSAIADLIVSLSATALSYSSIKGAEKWNF